MQWHGDVPPTAEDQAPTSCQWQEQLANYSEELAPKQLLSLPSC